MESTPLFQLITEHSIQFGITLAVIIVYVAIDRFSTPLFARGAEDGQFKAGAEIKAIRIARSLTAFISITALIITWGIDVQSILIFASTTLTLLAVALVASWSLLSNVTAHLILLLDSRFKRGTFVRILDGDNYLEGYISELGLFSTRIVTDNREMVAYPNNLFLTRPVLINPRVKLRGMGKLPPATANEPEPADNE